MGNKLNVIRGSGATLTQAGWVINQTAYFEGLTGAAYGNTAAGLIAEAYQTLLGNGFYIGKFLEFHDDSWPIVLDQMDFRLLTPANQEVGLVWRSRRYSTLRANFTTSAGMEQTNVNYNGSPISVKYTYPADYPEEDRQGTEETTGAMINKLVPEMNVEISRTEWGPTYGGWPGDDISKTLMTKKSTYEGKINQGTFSPVPGGDAAQQGSWLCTGINAVTNDTGVTYDVTYSFAYRENYSVDIGGTPTAAEGWDTVVVFVDPATGRPVPDPDADSMKVVQVYDRVDMSNIYATQES